jgi:ribosomal 50S subunit-recycling heat shock protein
MKYGGIERNNKAMKNNEYVKVEDNISIILENEDGSNEINATCL